MRFETPESPGDGRVHRANCSFAEAMVRLETDPSARAGLTQILATSALPAFFWECRPTIAPAGDPFEFVLLPAPSLEHARPNPAPFRRPLAGGPRDGVRAFDNLSGDSRLVAPIPGPDLGAGTHLAQFARHAPPAQVDALWTCVAHEALAWLERDDRPLWLSTSGLAVRWLHIRLDGLPKYIAHCPYRATPWIERSPAEIGGGDVAKK